MTFSDRERMIATLYQIETIMVDFRYEFQKFCYTFFLYYRYCPSGIGSFYYILQEQVLFAKLNLRHSFPSVNLTLVPSFFNHKTNTTFLIVTFEIIVLFIS